MTSIQTILDWVDLVQLGKGKAKRTLRISWHQVSWRKKDRQDRRERSVEVQQLKFLIAVKAKKEKTPKAGMRQSNPVQKKWRSTT